MARAGAALETLAGHRLVQTDGERFRLLPLA
jgi:hypothetical protein